MRHVTLLVCAASALSLLAIAFLINGAQPQETLAPAPADMRGQLPAFEADIGEVEVTGNEPARSVPMDAAAQDDS